MARLHGRRRGAKVRVRFYSSMLIRGIGKNSKSQPWLGTAGHHRGSRRRQRSLIYGVPNWSLTLVVVVCIYGIQCVVGLFAGTPASNCLRASLQAKTIAFHALRSLSSRAYVGELSPYP